MKLDLVDWFEKKLPLLQEEFGDGGGSVALRERSRDAAAFVVDADGEKVISQFIVWPSGAVEATVLDVVSGEQAYAVHATIDDDLDRLFDAFLGEIRRINAHLP